MRLDDAFAVFPFAMTNRIKFREQVKPKKEREM